jgi:hypothetical protein
MKRKFKSQMLDTLAKGDKFKFANLDHYRFMEVVRVSDCSVVCKGEVISKEDDIEIWKKLSAGYCFSCNSEIVYLEKW